MSTQKNATLLSGLGQHLSPFVGSLFGYTVTNGELLSILLNPEIPAAKTVVGVQGNKQR